MSTNIQLLVDLVQAVRRATGIVDGRKARLGVFFFQTSVLTEHPFCPDLPHREPNWFTSSICHSTQFLQIDVRLSCRFRNTRLFGKARVDGLWDMSKTWSAVDGEVATAERGHVFFFCCFFLAVLSPASDLMELAYGRVGRRRATTDGVNLPRKSSNVTLGTRANLLARCKYE